jgi:hypothetical protein
MELTGEFPPIVRKDGRGKFFDLMTHAFGLAELGGAGKHAYEAAQRVRRERDEELKSGNPEFIQWRDEILRAMGDLKEYRRPRRGPK